MNHLPLSSDRPGIFGQLLAAGMGRALDRLVKIASAARTSRLSSRLTKNAQVFRTFRRVIEDMVPRAQRSLGLFRGPQDFKTSLLDYIANPSLRYRTTTELLETGPSPEEVARYGAVVEKLAPVFGVHYTNPSTIETQLASQAFRIPEQEFLKGRVGDLLRRIADHIPWFRSPHRLATTSEYMQKVFPSLMRPMHPYSDEQLLRFLSDFRKRILTRKYPNDQSNIQPHHIPKSLIDAAVLDYMSTGDSGLRIAPTHDYLQRTLSELYNKIMFGTSWMWQHKIQPPDQTIYMVKPSYSMFANLHELGHAGVRSLLRLAETRQLDQAEKIARSDPYWSRMFDAAYHPVSAYMDSLLPIVKDHKLRFEVAANQIAEALIERMKNLNEDIPYIGDAKNYRLLADRAFSSYIEPVHNAILGVDHPEIRSMLELYVYDPSVPFEKFRHPILDQLVDAASRWKLRVLEPRASRAGYRYVGDFLRRLHESASRAMSREFVPSELAGPLSVKVENITNPNVIPLEELYSMRHFFGNLYHHHPKLFLGAGM